MENWRWAGEWARGTGAILRALVVSCVATAVSATLTSAVRGQDIAAVGVPGDELVVYLMTIGPGDAIWESFGHNAIWIRDQAAATDIAYNYGMFDFAQPGFIPRLMRGTMLYWMEGFDGQASARFYRSTDRSIVLQELNLTPAQRTALRDYLVWNERPENRFYEYDYYRDNCSTRVRDALDRTLSGQIRAALEGRHTGETYRSHTLRLTAHKPAASTGLQLALGSVEQPIDAWQEGFIPMELAAHLRTVRVLGPDGDSVPLVRAETVLFEAAREPPPETPPDRLPFYLVTGIMVAAALLVSGLRAPAGGVIAIVFATIATLWTAVVGFFGLIIALLWGVTGHVVTYANENVLHVNPLPIALAIMLPFIAAGVHRFVRPAARIALVVAALSVIGLLLQILPAFDQWNGEIIALVLPSHLAMAWVLSRWSGPVPSLKMDDSADAWRERDARASGRYR